MGFPHGSRRGSLDLGLGCGSSTRARLSRTALGALGDCWWLVVSYVTIYIYILIYQYVVSVCSFGDYCIFPNTMTYNDIQRDDIQ